MKIRQSARFKRDLKAARKRGLNMDMLDAVLGDIIRRPTMPNYNLYCPTCEKEHNIRASMTQKAEKTIPCPDCGSFDLETVFKAAPAYVKGSAPTACQNSASCGARCPHAS